MGWTPEEEAWVGGESGSWPTVSVVIPAHAAALTLPECLAALAAQREEIHEVIVVDDASPDGSAQAAAALGARVVRLERNGGPSRARNAGAALAGGEALFFVDADVVVMPGAVARVRAFLGDHPEVAAVFGSYDDRPRAPGLVSRYRNLLHHFVHQTGREEASTFWAACGAVRRESFLAVGGFSCQTHPRCIEDIELGYRLRERGFRIRLDKGLTCTHLKRWTLAGMVRTDVLCRAIPWARLNLDRRQAPGDLNLKASQVASVGAMGAALACLPLGLWWRPFLAAAGVLLAGVILLNLPLLGFLAARRGPAFAAACVPLHFLYFVYSGASWLYVRLARLVGAVPRDGNRG